LSVGLGQQPLGAIIHSSDEQNEPHNDLSHDDSIIHIGIIIVVVILVPTARLP